MCNENMRHDRGSRTWTGIIACLLAIIAVSLWDRGPAVLPTVAAQVPDTGKQRLDILMEARKTNQLLLEIRDLLKKGPVPVKLQAAGEAESPPSGG